MVKFAKSLAFGLSNLALLATSQTTIEIDYSLTPGAFEILTNFINDPSWIDSLLEHGCWCAKLDPDSTQIGLGGRTPTDDLDTICKQWAQSRSCTRLSGASCESYSHQSGGTYHYEIDYVYGLEDSICPDLDTCFSETCQIDLFYVKQIVDWKSQNNDQLTPVTPMVCDVGAGGPGLHSHCASVTTTQLPITTLAYCTCANGNGSSGAACPTNGAEKCDSCNTGFFLNTVNACEANECTCANGAGAVGAPCGADGVMTCATCDYGYYLTESLTRTTVYVCPENVCTCENGSGNTNTDCAAHESASCASCDSGYNLQGDVCVENVCTCDNGSGAVNTDCAIDNDSVCAGCDSGYFLNGSSCELNVCNCSSGTAAMGTACPYNGDSECTSCNTGFYSALVK